MQNAQTEFDHQLVFPDRLENPTGNATSHSQKKRVQTCHYLELITYNKRNAPNDFGALKITIQQFYRPNGDSTQLRGVLADIVLPSVTDKLDVGESDLDYPVQFDRVRRAKYASYAMTSPRMIEELGERSASRRNSSNDFQKPLSNISKYFVNRDLKSVSLNEERSLARRQRLSAGKEKENAVTEQINTNEINTNEIKRDFYLDEVLRITLNYMDSQSERSKTALFSTAARSQTALP